MNGNLICYPINNNIENFDNMLGIDNNELAHFDNNGLDNFDNTNGSANRTLIGEFFYAGLGYRTGQIGSRTEDLVVDLGFSYVDNNGNNIEGSINILEDKTKAGFPMILDLTDTSNNSIFKYYYGGHYDDFTGGRHALMNNVDGKVISSKVPSGGLGYSTILRMYYYPLNITPGSSLPTPSGYTKYTVVSQGEVQFFNNSTQVCLINDGSFPNTPIMNDYSVKANGLPDNTKIVSYSFGRSKFNGTYSNTIYVNLSNTIDTINSDGYFFIKSPPPPPTTAAPTTIPALTTAPISTLTTAPISTVTTAPISTVTTYPVATSSSSTLTSAPVSAGANSMIAGAGAPSAPSEPSASSAPSVPSAPPAPPAPSTEEAPKSNMMLYAGIAGGVVLLIVVFMMMGGKKKSSDDD